MNCEKVKALLPDILYGELNEPDRREAQAHLDACSTCHAEWRSLRQTMDVLDRWTEVDAPRPARDVAPHAGSALKVSSKPPSWLRACLRSAAIGGLAAAIAFGILLWTGAEVAYSSAGWRVTFAGDARARADADPGSAQPEFMLLLASRAQPGAGDGPFQIESSHVRQRIDEYLGWARRIREQGRAISGEKLTADAGRLLSGAGDELAIADVVSGGACPTLGGYFRISAESYEDAVAVAATCPHLKHGGIVEVRQIQRLSP